MSTLSRGVTFVVAKVLRLDGQRVKSVFTRDLPLGAVIAQAITLAAPLHGFCPDEVTLQRYNE